VSDPAIRETVLSRLDSRFDYHLAQAENLRSLFIALNDEVFEIRELAITTIGRLTIRNPAYVMPSLRKTLIQLLTELGTQTPLPYFFLIYLPLRSTISFISFNLYILMYMWYISINAEFSGDSRNKEESARLLGHLISSSQRLIKPYVEPILNALLPKLQVPRSIPDILFRFLLVEFIFIYLFILQLDCRTRTRGWRRACWRRWASWRRWAGRT
jgi:FKBP12-rapamycin complex-associated protein